MNWKKYKFLFTFNWIIIEILIITFTIFCFKILAPWQLGKNSSVKENNQKIASALKEPPQRFEAIHTKSPVELAWKKVLVTGKFSPNSYLLVRLRSYNNKPAFEILNTFTTSTNERILVNRGYLYNPEQKENIPVPVPPTNKVTITAYLRTYTKTPVKVSKIGGVYQVKEININSIRPIFQLSSWDGYLQLLPDQPGVLNPIPLPVLDAGPYLSYGIQWTAFGILAPLALIYFIREEMIKRRKIVTTSTPNDKTEQLEQLLKNRYQ